VTKTPRKNAVHQQSLTKVDVNNKQEENLNEKTDTHCALLGHGAGAGWLWAACGTR
jgi:hypothetical protein